MSIRDSLPAFCYHRAKVLVKVSKERKNSLSSQLTLLPNFHLTPQLLDDVVSPTAHVRVTWPPVSTAVGPVIVTAM